MTTTPEKTIKQEKINIKSLISIIQEIDKAVWVVVNDTKKYNWKRYVDTRLLLLAEFHEMNLETIHSLELLAEGYNVTNSKE